MRYWKPWRGIVIALCVWVRRFKCMRWFEGWLLKYLYPDDCIVTFKSKPTPGSVSEPKGEGEGT